MARTILGFVACCGIALAGCSSNSNNGAQMGAVSGEKACCKSGEKAACCKDGAKAGACKDGAKAGACCKDSAAKKAE